ncbi:MAG: 2-keto-4-pentenoate hydratase [Hyphomicrobiaceae bacterium]
MIVGKSFESNPTDTVQMIDNPTPSANQIAAVVDTILKALDDRRQIKPLTGYMDWLDLTCAYQLAADVRARRMARGETPIGRKIGFTNRTIWEEYGVYAPIWGDVYDTTVTTLNATNGLCDLSRLIEPRIEPEIVFELKSAPHSDMPDIEFTACISRVAHGFEIVQSLFPGWIFKAPDTVAAFGLHGHLFLAPWSDLTPQNQEEWSNTLANFEITLARDGNAVDVGHAKNVLDGPLFALRHLCQTLENDPNSPQLQPGEIVSTGTLTRAFIIEPGQTWTTSLRGIALDGIKLST